MWGRDITRILSMEIVFRNIRSLFFHETRRAVPPVNHRCRSVHQKKTFNRSRRRPRSTIWQGAASTPGMSFHADRLAHLSIRDSHFEDFFLHHRTNDLSADIELKEESESVLTTGSSPAPSFPTLRPPYPAGTRYRPQRGLLVESFKQA